LEIKAAAEIERRKRRKDSPPIWTPYKDGPQERAYNSPADVTGYGGAAGGGKTDLALGLALTAHQRSIIFRREYPQTKGIVDRAKEIIGDKGSYNGQQNTFRLNDGRVIELGACQRIGDRTKYRGRPHDLLVIDEATEFFHQAYLFLSGWLRSTIEGQRCRILLTFNPPTDVEGEWIVRYFAPWLDDTHPRPADPGELRWYATVDGDEVERENGNPFEHNGETIQPLSRTFFPARLADNPALAKTGYGATLQALPEPLRSQLLYGDFKAGVQEDAWQAIPTKWIKAAIERWKLRPQPQGPMIAMGMDVAHGGKDKTCFAPRYGDWFGQIVSHPGSSTPDGKSAAALAIKAYQPGAVINVDAIGYGASAAERLKDPAPDGYGVKANAVNVGAKSKYRDKSGKYQMFNVRAEMFWRMREALDPDNDPTLCLPDDAEMLADLTSMKYEVTPSGIKIESKDDIKERIGRSPDKGDAVGLAMLPGPAVWSFV
jgi:hypothetical protein